MTLSTGAAQRASWLTWGAKDTGGPALHPPFSPGLGPGTVITPGSPPLVGGHRAVCHRPRVNCMSLVTVVQGLNKPLITAHSRLVSVQGAVWWYPRGLAACLPGGGMPEAMRSAGTASPVVPPCPPGAGSLQKTPAHAHHAVHAPAAGSRRGHTSQQMLCQTHLNKQTSHSQLLSQEGGKTSVPEPDEGYKKAHYGPTSLTHTDAKSLARCEKTRNQIRQHTKSTVCYTRVGAAAGVQGWFSTRR